ncbi:MAG: hypothetical protein ACI865_000279 [Flavobacteriaceae bacterium]|jgi:hypothetical protein
MKTNQILLLLLGIVCIGAAITMYVVGSDSSHLSELKDYWWIPLPLALVSFGGAFKKR